MSNESLPNYAPGFTISVDRHGHLSDNAASMTERWCNAGHAWRIDTGYVSLAADGDYHLVSFKTPAVGKCYYSFASVDKSGSEVIVELVRAPTITGASVATMYNYNDNIADATCPFVDVKTGGTYTGGTSRFLSLIPGTSTPASKVGGASRQQGLVILRPNTVYALKISAKGGAVTFAANVGIAYIEAEEIS